KTAYEILACGVQTCALPISLISLAWLVRPSKMSQAMVARPGLQMLVIGIRGALLLLAGSLLANIIGFVSLSQVLGLTALVGPFEIGRASCRERMNVSAV